MRVTITEHTTTEDTMCVIQDYVTKEKFDWYGTIEQFRQANPFIEIVEEVWS